MGRHHNQSHQRCFGCSRWVKADDWPGGVCPSNDDREYDRCMSCLQHLQKCVMCKKYLPRSSFDESELRDNAYTHRCNACMNAYVPEEPLPVISEEPPPAYVTPADESILPEPLAPPLERTSSLELLLGSQKAEFREIFTMFDRDCDGRISSSELGTVMRSLGQDLTKDELQAIIDDVDTNHNGQIDPDEFEELMRREVYSGQQPEDTERVQIEEMFKSFDINGDGMLDKRDIRRIMQFLDIHLNLNEAQDMINHAEPRPEDDGNLCLDCFTHMILKNKVRK